MAISKPFTRSKIPQLIEDAALDPSFDSEAVVDYKDKSNTRSLVNISPTALSKAIEVLPNKLFTLGEEELKKQAKVDLIDERLRHSFWLEYSQADIGRRQINLSNVYNGVCNQAYMFKTILGNSFKLAYMLTPPPAFKVTMSELLTLGLEQLRDILVQPHKKVDDEGNVKVDARLAAVKANIIESIINRNHGNVKQSLQIESKNMNVSLDLNKPQAATAESLEELDRKIKELEANQNGGLLDVSPIREEDQER